MMMSRAGFRLLAAREMNGIYFPSTVQGRINGPLGSAWKPRHR